MRIAVINSDPGFIALVRHLLDDRGWTTLACCDGAAAIDFVRRERPHAIMLDARMEPTGRRWQLVPRLRRDPKTRKIPVIMCTAGATDLRERAQYLESHGVLSLARPFSSETLYRVLDSALGRRQSRDGRRVHGPRNG